MLTETVREHSPPFLIANIAALDLQLPESSALRTRRHLTREDTRTLRDNYIKHWGIIYVAGKHLEIGGDGSIEFPILIPGTYTVEGSGPVEIDAVALSSGATVQLDRDRHTLSGPTGTKVTLRWGDDLYRPNWPPPPPPIFLGL